MATNIKTYNCGKCGLGFKGRQEFCPHCETIINYPDTVFTCGNCKKPFKGRKDNCPHCDNKMKYKTVADIKKERQDKAEKIKAEQQAQAAAKKIKSKKQTKIILIAIGVLAVVITCWILYAKMTAPTKYDLAKEKMIAGEISDAYYAMKRISESSSDYDSAQYWTVYLDSMMIVEDSLKKIEDEKEAEKELENQIEAIKREIEAIPKFSNKKYRGSIDDLSMELIVFGVWDLLIKEGKHKISGKEANELTAKFEKKVIALKKKEFPLMRKEYGKQAKKVLWESDINVTTWGSRNESLVFTGGTFASNKNIKDFHLEILDIVKSYRFKKVIYKWYDGDDEYTYYDLKPKKDSQ